MLNNVNINTINVGTNKSLYVHDTDSINKLKEIFPASYEMHKSSIDFSCDVEVFYYFDKNEDIIIDNISELKYQYILKYSNTIFSELEKFMDACQDATENKLPLDCPRNGDEYLKSSLPIDWDSIAYTGKSSVVGKKQEMNISSEEFYQSFPIDISNDEKIKYDIYSEPIKFETEQYIPNSNSIKFNLILH